MDSDYQKLGENMAKLFLYAMVKSGTGPRGMTLQTKGGVAAFLRAVQYHLCVEFTFDKAKKTMYEYAKDHELPYDIDEGKNGRKGLADQMSMMAIFKFARYP
jgi:hypothetical protein